MDTTSLVSTYKIDEPGFEFKPFRSFTKLFASETSRPDSMVFAEPMGKYNTTVKSPVYPNKSKTNRSVHKKKKKRT